MKGDRKRKRVDGASSSAASSANFATEPPEKLNDYVYEVHRPQGRPSIEIVFFHGLQLEESKEVYLTTWLSADGSQLWLRWILKNVPDARILLISYDASTRRTFEGGLTDMYITCENLVHSLTDDKAHVGEDGCPVLLVGHSLGGLVMKALCTKLHEIKSKRPNQRVENLLLNIKALFFYACPHHGSRLADSSTSFSKGLLFEDVTILNKDTQRRNEDFRELRNTYGWKTYGIGEGRATTWGEFKNIQIVTEASARQDVDNFYTADADHFNAPEEQGPQIDIPHEVIGLEEQVKTIVEKLKGAPRVGIAGMGGIGKTTLAKVVFNTISVGFEYTCFLTDVKILMANQSDPRYLQQRIVEQMFHKGHEVDKSFKWRSLKQKEVLIVLDDVDCESQVQVMSLLDAFSDKSRLIVTSRDSGFLKAEKFDCHFVKLLDIENSERLFCLNAFNSEDQRIDYKDRVLSIVKKCEGWPLAIRVVGKYLRAEEQDSLWEDVLKKLRLAQPLTGTKKDPLWSILMLSYEALAPNEQQMFLDVSTCFHGQSLDVGKGVWTVCGWATPHSGFKNLFDKGLLTIEKNKIQMHEVLRDLGRSIACPDPENIACHSRICCEGSNPLETQPPDGDNFEVKILKIGRVPHINIQMLHGLKELRILWIYGPRTVLHGPWNLLPPKLAYIRIENCQRRDGFYPGASHRREGLPFEFREPFSEPLGKLPKLRHLEIDNFENMGDYLGTLGELQGLEYLSICRQELKALPETLGQLQALKSLKICFCPRLEYIPSSLGQLLNLKSLVIHYCKSLRAIPCSLGRLQALEDLRLSRSGLEAPTHSLGQLKALRHLEITWCDDGKDLLDALGQLPALQKIVVHRCMNHKDCPSSIDQLQFLDSITTMGRLQGVGQVDLPVLSEKFVEIVASKLQAKSWRFWQLPEANFLTVKNCRNLKYLEVTLAQFQALECLKIQDCDGLEALPHTLGELRALRELTILSCGHLESLPDSLGKLQALETLTLVDCNSLESLPRTLGELQLKLLSCRRLKCLPNDLGKLQALERLEIEDCHSLEALPHTLGELRALRELKIHSCGHLESLPRTLGELQALQQLKLLSCRRLKCLPDGLGKLQALERLEIKDCHSLEALPHTLGELRALRALYIHSCGHLKSLPDSLGKLQALETLTLVDCNSLESLPDGLGRLQALQCLVIRHCYSLESLPRTLGKLALRYCRIDLCRHLMYHPYALGDLGKVGDIGDRGAQGKLVIRNCIVEALPNTLGDLLALQRLKIESCENLKSLPDALGNLRALLSLDICHCNNLEALPGTLGELQALEELRIESCEELKSLPDALGNLQKLKSLELVGCNNLEALPGTLGELQALEELWIESCEELKSLPDSLGNLQALLYLNIRHCNNLEALPGTLGELQALDQLSIESCEELKSLPDALGNLQKLKSLELVGCNNLEALPGTLGELQALEQLRIESCEELKSLPDSLGNLQALLSLHIRHCNNLEALPGTLWGTPGFRKVKD